MAIKDDNFNPTKEYKEIIRNLDGFLYPGELPLLQGIDVFGGVIRSETFGGDRIRFIDFKKNFDLDSMILETLNKKDHEKAASLTRYKNKLGIFLTDIEGHESENALISLIIDSLFWAYSDRYFKQYGNIIKRLFDEMSDTLGHILQISPVSDSLKNKTIPFIYAEIDDKGEIAFVIGGHEPPSTFSCANNTLNQVDRKYLDFRGALNLRPSQSNIYSIPTTNYLGVEPDYKVIKWKLEMPGDLLFFYTDGLSDHAFDQIPYFPQSFEKVIASSKDKSAEEIFVAIKKDILSYSKPMDEISLIIVKKL